MNKHKYPERFYDNPFVSVPCSNCKYRIGLTPACEAYPNGLTSTIICKVYEHPDRECAKGYKYTPKDDTTEQDTAYENRRYFYTNFKENDYAA